MDNEKKVFKLHIGDEELKKEQRTVKSVFQDAGKQILASLLILVIGFFVLNWSAYYKIGKTKLYSLVGIERESPLAEFVDTDTLVRKREVMATSTDPEIQKRQIPKLDLEISPVDNRIIIPRINQNIPIISVTSESLIKRDWVGLERDMQRALRDGVIYYPGTSNPGQTGNTVITGHSSYFPWDPGRFKDVFALLHEVVVGDRIVVYHNQDKYIYEVFEVKVVLPEDIEILKQTPEEQLTLITCTPVGTNLKRLILKARPIAKNGLELNGGRILR